jgi:hypothetical protein
MSLWLRTSRSTGCDVATIVDRVPHPAGNETGVVLEVFNAIGESIKTIAVPESAIEPLNAGEVLAIRCLEPVGARATA